MADASEGLSRQIRGNNHETLPKYAFPRHIEVPTDEGRVDQIGELVKHGHGNQVLVSHDSLTVDLMAINGGPGIVHIPNKVVPMMREKGFSEDQIQAITVANPARALSIA